MNIIETDSGFEVRFPYDPVKVAAIKTIKGAQWRGQHKFWFIPRYREREVASLKKVYGLAVNPVIEMPEQIGTIPDLPKLDIDIPLARKMFPFQEPGVAYNRLFKKTIIGDDPGLGKSTQAIATIMSFGLDLENMLNLGPGLIICPNTLCLNWQQEWNLVAGRRSVVLNNKVKANWQDYYRSKLVDVFIINYESIKSFFVRPGWKKPEGGKLHSKDIPFRESAQMFNWFIIDESHKCKEPTTIRTKLVIALTKKKEIVMELTGTPVVNKPYDLIPQLVIIDRLKDVVSHIPQPRDANGKLTDWTGVQRFTMRYCSVDERGNYMNQKELNYRLNKCCFYRREKKDVLKDLPDKIRQIVLCDITNRVEYDKAHNDLQKYLKDVRNCTDKDIRKKMKAEVLVRIGVLKQISARGKMESAGEAIDEVIEAGQKIVIFCNLKEIVQQVKSLYPQAMSITGSDSLEERDRAIKLFQSDPERNVIVCNIKTGGVGITLTASSEVLFIEFPWHDADCRQCEDRTHRIGQKSSVRARYLLGDGTIDRWCYNLIQKKKSIAKAISGDEHDIEEEIVDDLYNLFNQQ